MSNNILEQFNAKQIAVLSKDKSMPDFRPGDTVSVGIKKFNSKQKRSKVFIGLCIKKRNRGLHSSFVLRKISAHGVSVEVHLPLYSPSLEDFKVVKRGRVRRAKLYYIRKLSGKAARIKEKLSF